MAGINSQYMKRQVHILFLAHLSTTLSSPSNGSFSIYYYISQIHNVIYKFSLDNNTLQKKKKLNKVNWKNSLNSYFVSQDIAVTI